MNSQGQEPGAGRHDARRAARWCMSVLRAWLPTHPPTSNARMQCRCSSRLRKNHFGTAELWWPAYLEERDPNPQDSRARLAGRARRGGNPICPRAPFSHVSRFTRHGLWRWRAFSASC